MTQRVADPENTFDIVKLILVQELGVEETRVIPEAHLLKDLEMDSTDTVMVSLEVKKQLNVELNLQIRDDPTVGQIVEQIDSLQVGMFL